MRCWIWLAASVKFLIPFSLLVSAGSQLGWRTTPAMRQFQFSFVMEEISRPFALQSPTSMPAVAQPASAWVPEVLFGVWLCGFASSVMFYLRSWRRIRAAQRMARPLHLNVPIRVMSSPVRLEPGVFGIFKPVWLLPEGITAYLPPAQLKAIVAHEMCHLRRRDNLTGAIHMIVEATFWFYPLLWGIRERLVEERERACDEEVLRQGSDPEVYAGSILEVCQFYLESPLVCVAGVTGSDLEKRIEGIMTHRISVKLDFGRKLLVATLGMAAVAGPVAIGLVQAPLSRAQQQAEPAARMKFEAASIKPSPPGTRAKSLNLHPGGRVIAQNMDLKSLICLAYRLAPFQVSGRAKLARLRRIRFNH